MAAGISMSGVQFGVAVALDAADTTTVLDQQYAYEIMHTGVGNTGAAEPVAVFLAIGSTVTDDFAAETNKYVLISGNKVFVAPGNSMIAYEANGAAAAGVCLSITRSPHLLGQF